ncbi:hypothetical protein MAUB1S_01486 [Mycolicibacterium aubagnense]
MKRGRLPRGLRRTMAVLAVAAVLMAGVVVVDRDDAAGVGLSALPGATGQPTGPTGGAGSGGGLGGPPFPMQPPGMPDGPGAYNGGSYPAPDQGNGISLYNPDQQSAGSPGGYQQAPNYPQPQQQMQPANGTQPPDYDAPLQPGQQYSTPPPYTGTQSIPNTAPARPQQGPHQPSPAPTPTQPPVQQSTDQTPAPRFQQISKSSGGDPWGVAGSENECYSHRAFIPG